jgi:hypothetical protein
MPIFSLNFLAKIFKNHNIGPWSWTNIFYLGPSRDRCYDFLNIFAEKFGEKNGIFDSKQSRTMQNFDHDIGF